MHIIKNWNGFLNENVNKKGQRNHSWSMRQSCGEAHEGFMAYLNGKSFNDNPYKDAKNHKDGVKYKDWCEGWRNGEDATPEQINMFKWIHSIR